MKKTFVILYLIFFLLIFAFAEKRGYLYNFKNPEIPIEQRIKNLISRLTLKEKAALMLYDSPSIERLGIPAYNWWNEALHGVARAGKATVFPQAIGLAATFDSNLLYRIGKAISDEARAKYNAAVKKGNRFQYAGLTFWSPNINIFRDPRWGRGQETYGEDPFLTAKMGIAFVKGMQGDDKRYLKVSACGKHFAVHSGPEVLRHEFNAVPDIRDFYETYLYPFEKLVKDGIVSGIMCAYNRTYGKPCCGSEFLLQDILRKKWGFRGYITSDCWALDDIFKKHKSVKTAVEAAAMAVKASVNLNCGYVYKYIPEAVKKGLIKEKDVDRRLFELLKIRFLLGEFDPPELNPYSKISGNVVNSKAHKKLAYEAAVKSIVLLENKRNVLPLNLKKIKDILLVGPLCSAVQALVGNYNGYSPDMYTFLEGITERAGIGTIVEYSQGFLLSDPDEKHFRGFWESGRADVVIACLGINYLYEGEQGDAVLNPEGGDRKDLKLPENQIKYLKKLREKIGEKPLILIMTGGSVISIPEIRDIADAILFAWYPGEQGGLAVADILFGKVSPSGKSPITFYKSVKDLLPFDDYRMEGRTYRFFKGTPLYPFGYGLSYTKFKYINTKIPEKIQWSSKLVNIRVKLKNIGKFDGEEVVQIYARKINPEKFRPLKQLVGFSRVFLKIGETREIQVKIELEPLRYWDSKSNEFKFENGKYEILVGSSSSDIRLKKVIEIR